MLPVKTMDPTVVYVVLTARRTLRSYAVRTMNLAMFDFAMLDFTMPLIG